MLTSKERAKLRAMANGIDTILQIGKDGITGNVVSQADGALSARELIKGRVLDNSMLGAREASDELCRLLRAEPVQCVGSRFVIYRMNREKPVIRL